MTSQLARAAIISVGNELLFGETINTNAAWLGRALAAKGIVVSRGSVSYTHLTLPTNREV